MVVLAPKDTHELREMTRFALRYDDGPIAVRYPRGGSPALPQRGQPVELGRAEMLVDFAGRPDVAFIALGAGVPIACEAAGLIAARGMTSLVINARFCKPLDEQAILNAARRAAKIVTVEDGVLMGGFGSSVLELLSDHNVTTQVLRFGLPDSFVEHGPIPVLRDLVGLTAGHIAARLTNASPEIYDPLRRQEPAGHKLRV
jgi:1-deoxy-D-xylulose-5-phosphate synthase